nr:orf101 [Escherichia coli K-12]
MLQSNEYFSGKVKSIGFSSSSTGRASVGVMVEGEYTFSTAEPEEMTVISGALNVLLPDATDWQVYEAGSVFNVPGHTVSFICKLPNPPLICAAICNSSPSP